MQDILVKRTSILDLSKLPNPQMSWNWELKIKDTSEQLKVKIIEVDYSETRKGAVYVIVRAIEVVGGLTLEEIRSMVGRNEEEKFEITVQAMTAAGEVSYLLNIANADLNLVGTKLNVANSEVQIVSMSFKADRKDVTLKGAAGEQH